MTDARPPDPGPSRSSAAGSPRGGVPGRLEPTVAARAWIAADPDPTTRAELSALLAGADTDGPGCVDARAELADRFAGTLRFGTAGLRGAMGAGPNRMNRAVVITAAAGLAGWLGEQVTTPRVVIGFDARHGSVPFAEDTAAVFTAAGCRVWLLPRPLPTPILAFAVRRLRADAGVMVTASHNPPGDNGVKVYLGGRIASGTGDGVQVVPPADEEIAARMTASGAARDVPRAETGWTVLDEDVVEAYLRGAATVATASGSRTVDVVATPLHGVGGPMLSRAFVGAGFAAPFLVPSQAEPDPDFRTVAFPNPEEPGVLDAAVAVATERGADLVIATDPDADRCAVAVPVPTWTRSTSGTDREVDTVAAAGWRMLRGDELGALLGEYVLTRPGGVPEEVDGTPATVASSIVSSQLLGRIAAAHGVRHVQTLTGFKWIGRVPGLVYGYEEALGYCVAPSLVRDKDGITAALLVTELAAKLAGQGRTLLHALDALAARYGVHATEQVSVRMSRRSRTGTTMARLRADPPRTLAGAPLTTVDDLRAGSAGLPPTDGLRWRVGDEVRVLIRPSGTEPKLKCYLEVVLPPGGQIAADRRAAADRLTQVREDVAALLRRPS